MIQAWAQEQDESSKRDFKEQDVLVPWRMQKFFEVETLKDCNANDSSNSNLRKEEIDSSSEQQFNSATVNNETVSIKNAEIAEDRGMKVYQRYCHVYKQGELETLCER